VLTQAHSLSSAAKRAAMLPKDDEEEAMTSHLPVSASSPAMSDALLLASHGSAAPDREPDADSRGATKNDRTSSRPRALGSASGQDPFVGGIHPISSESIAVAALHRTRRPPPDQDMLQWDLEHPRASGQIADV
jgi:hypothetical protein